MAAVATATRTCPAWCDTHVDETNVCLGANVTVDVTDREPYMAKSLSVGLAQCPGDVLTVGLAINYVGPHEVTVAAAKAFALAILAQVEAAEAAAVALVPGPRGSAKTDSATTVPNVISVCGGKVHYGHGELLDEAFPLCRTGEMTNSGTKYFETTLEVTCANCLQRGLLTTQNDTEASAPSYAQTVTALAREYRAAKVNGRIPQASHQGIVDRLVTAAAVAGVAEGDALDDLFDEVAAPPVQSGGAK